MSILFYVIFIFKWQVEEKYLYDYGVLETKVGYVDGKTENPTYNDVCSGITGHAEAVQVIYNSKIIQLDELIDIFFMIHDPTSVDRQGPDFGTQYRSGIYYYNSADRAIILKKIKESLYYQDSTFN